jgi:3-hydroxyisobutyrate dehydrogenase-like beta-hydroxyacid dehydrogenase
MEKRPVGIVGVGNMGLAMTLRLRDLGFEVHVRDIDPAREALAVAAGALRATTPAELARRSEAVIVAVVDAAQSEDVVFGVDGAASAMAPGGCVVLCPTIAPTSTEAIASRLAASGLDAIDAPMSGGPARARSGTMSLMVACKDGVFARWQHLLEALAEPVLRIGERVGDGARTKLVNNLLAAVNLVGAAEAIALAERVGLDAARTLDVIERSSGQSWIASDRMRRAIAGDLAPRAHTTLLAKDSALAMAMAAAAGVAPRLGGGAAATFAAAVAAGHGSDDDASLLAFLRASERSLR